MRWLLRLTSVVTTRRGSSLHILAFDELRSLIQIQAACAKRAIRSARHRVRGRALNVTDQNLVCDVVVGSVGAARRQCRKCSTI
jgi:hypothetical protein